MNPQINLRYPHSDHPPVLRDMRKQNVAEIKLEQCYLVGFRISTDTCYRYHRSLLLADNYDSLLQGIKAAHNAILDKQYDLFESDVSLIFVRSLMMQSEAVVNSVKINNIQAETQEILSRRDDNKFAVFGLLGDGIFLEQVNATNALAAIKLARSRCPTESISGFLPLEICQAHPVTKEFDTLFLTVANQLKSLISAGLSDKGYRH